MAFALVASVSVGTDADGGTSASVDTSGADFLIAHTSSAAGIGSTLSDSKGNTWTQLTARVGGVSELRTYYVASPIVGSGHTISVAGSETYASVSMLAFSGAHATPFDQQNGATGSSTSLNCGSITPPEDNCLLVAGLSIDPSTNHAISLSYILEEDIEHDGSNFYGLAVAYKIQGSAAAQNPQWTWTTAAFSAAGHATFKAAASGGGAAHVRFASNLQGLGSQNTFKGNRLQ